MNIGTDEIRMPCSSFGTYWIQIFSSDSIPINTRTEQEFLELEI